MKRFLLFMTVGFTLIETTTAQIEKYQAAYLYQFTKYIDWCSAYKTGDFVIAIIGESLINAELQNMAKTKKIVNQNIVVKKYNSAAEISDAQIIFITKDKAGLLANVLSKIGSKCTLVISEKVGGAKNGAAISFDENGGKLSFDMNKSFFSGHNLGLSSQLANLAKNIY